MQMLYAPAFILLLFVLFVLNGVDGAEILMITLAGTKSHKIPFWALAKGLLARGHRVTFVNGFVPDGNGGGGGGGGSGEQVSGMREVTPSGLVHYIGNYTNWDLLGSRYAGRAPLTLWQAMRYPAEACNSLLQNNETLELLTQQQQHHQYQQQQHQQQQQQEQATSHERKYQLAIVDGAFPECALGLVHHLGGVAGGGGGGGGNDGGGGIPYIYINTVGFYTGSLAIAGNPIVYAVTPHVFSAYTHQMGFVQRLLNFITHLFAESLHMLCMWQVHEVLRARLHPATPHPYALARNVSFILHNGSPTLTYPRPLLPNVAEIACMHCRAAEPLSGELAAFVEAAPLGVILFSMGSAVRAANMPVALQTMLATVFARLPRYHVLWKWDGVDGDGNGDGPAPPAVSANVRLSGWLPQQDVLGHRRVKAFITHGGLLSMHEAVYHGVPMVMLPVFCDHDVNAAKAAADGYALRLPLEAPLTADALLHAIEDVLHNHVYQRAIRKHRRLLLDQPFTALETAVYWTEYVLRHRGAAHLQPAGRHMNFCVYHSLDVLGVLCAVPLAFALLLPVIMRRSASRFNALKSASGGKRRAPTKSRIKSQRVID